MDILYNNSERFDMSRKAYGHVGAKDNVWEKASTVRGYNPDTHRRDSMGHVIHYSSYGKATPMGWHIDHIKPQSKGGSDNPRNLQALQAHANMSKGNKYK
jgi:5-methylcytosine-specific restriction endonuclease McrA